MPSNVEIKAHAADLSRLRRVAASLAINPGETIEQEDVFFRTPEGRLKLRVLPDNTGQLIAYSRPDTNQAKLSNYEIYRTSDPQNLRAVLAAAFGELVIVRKVRQVFLVGQTRIHLDQVEGLGAFMELEVVLEPGQSVEEGRTIAYDLMDRLGVAETDLVSCAYADLLLRKHEGMHLGDARTCD